MAAFVAGIGKRGRSLMAGSAALDKDNPDPGKKGVGRHFPGGEWGGWFFATVVTWAIWLAVYLTQSGHPTEGFWPVWVMIPWGAVILANHQWRRR
jgi:hypothetical protein